MAAEAGARIHFDHMLQDFDLDKGTASFCQTDSPEVGSQSDSAHTHTHTALDTKPFGDPRS
eukprot:2466686-Amphidinium_carterae.1